MTMLELLPCFGSEHVYLCEMAATPPSFPATAVILGAPARLHAVGESRVPRVGLVVPPPKSNVELPLTLRAVRPEVSMLASSVPSSDPTRFMIFSARKA